MTMARPGFGGGNGEPELRPADDAAYPPIEDYAVIGDCRTAALISREGSVEWLCLPHFSGASVFAAMLDRERGGHFAVRPAGPFRSERRYVGDSAVLETTFVTASGRVRVTDFMPIIAGTGMDRWIEPERALMRVVEALEGTVDIEVSVAPRPEYGRAPVRLYDRRRVGWACSAQSRALILQSDVPLEAADDKASRLKGRCRLEAGEKRYLTLTFAGNDIAALLPLGDETERRLATTLDWWLHWSSACSYEGAYRDRVMRSLITLKLLTYSLSGAVVAAPTAGLPEAIGGGRNWDYRFCWLRDAVLTLVSFTDLGHFDEGEAFLGWLLNATRLTRPGLSVLYDVYGRAESAEFTLDHFEGYRGSRPVMIGNAAADQLQLDVYGAVVVVAYDYLCRGGSLDAFEKKLLVDFGKRVCAIWDRPDNGIWEIRGERRHYVHSKVLCWAALDRLIKLSEAGLVKAPADQFRHQRNAIREAIETRGYSAERGGYVANFEGTAADASLLLLPRYGYKSADDPRMAGTFRMIREELAHGSLLERYSRGHDGLRSQEGAFGICSFWQVDYLARCQKVREATETFEDLLRYGNDVGLYAEEIDLQTGAALGNFPQAFTHVGLIGAALSLDAARRGLGQEFMA
jgi:GH15 family glucan-1,4-alpha-glucosidase